MHEASAVCGTPSVYASTCISELILGVPRYTRVAVARALVSPKVPIVSFEVVAVFRPRQGLAKVVADGLHSPHTAITPSVVITF